MSKNIATCAEVVVILGKRKNYRAIVLDRRRCKRKPCSGEKYCWQHMIPKDPESLAKQLWEKDFPGDIWENVPLDVQYSKIDMAKDIIKYIYGENN